MAWTVLRTVTNSVDYVTAADHNETKANFDIVGGADGATKTGNWYVSGNVGIGTTSPSTTLHVVGNTTLNGDIIHSGTGKRFYADWTSASQSNRLTLVTSTANGNTLIEVTPNGTAIQSGINFCNTSDSLNTSVFQFMSNSVLGYISVDKRGTGSYLPIAFITSGTERMRITTAGYVGIGTSSPSATFHVSGESVFCASSSGTNVYIDSLSAQAAQLVFQNLGSNKWFIHSSGDTRLYILDSQFNDGVYMAQNATSWTSNSDSRLKDVKETISNALDKVNQLTGVKFTWKRDANNPDAKTRIGLIAQDVLSVLPEAVDDETPDIITDEETGKVSGGLGVRYTELVPLLVNAIKELAHRVEALEA